MNTKIYYNDKPISVEWTKVSDEEFEFLSSDPELKHVFSQTRVSSEPLELPAKLKVLNTIKRNVHSEIIHCEIATVRGTENLKAAVFRKPKSIVILLAGQTFEIDTSPKRRKSKASESSASEGLVMSPMPGKVLKILIQSGEEVSKGAPLVIIEAMKMEHTLKSSLDGKVETVKTKEGDQVKKGAVLVEVKKI